MKRKINTWLFSVLLIVGMIVGTVGTAQAAGAVRAQVTREIAVVFDNSGSMYASGNTAWCRATYALEVFASMMNEGDVLQVYPMHAVTVNGRTYTSEDPVSVSGGGDLSVIRNIYTPEASGTPIETIQDAYNGLQKTSADEKWLIVLTDGDTFYENSAELSAAATKTRLEEVLTEYNQSVNVLYLGIGAKATMPEVAENGTYLYYADKASASSDVLSKLTIMCNKIFGRDELPSTGKQITFDVSMKKLILFVQGDNISNVTLKDSSGASVGSPDIEYFPHYSEMGAGNYTFGVDKSLNGYIATYDIELDAGTYSLAYSGDVSNVSVYYEPDIDLFATLTDENNAVMNADSELYPGTYYINYGLVDKYGNTATSSLLGNTSYTVTYSINGERKTVESDKSGRVALELNEDDVLDGEFTVTYLSGYTITKASRDFNWPSGGFCIVPRPAGLLEIRLSGGQDIYKLSELEEQGSYSVQLLYEGTLLTADKLAAADLFVDIEGGNVGYAVTESGDGYLLELKYPADAAETGCGAYTVRVWGNYVNEFGVSSQSGEVTAAFTIEDDGYDLAIEVDGSGYFVISQLEESDPIKVILGADGAPLTDEQLATAVLTVDADGLTCEIEPLYGESAFAVRIVNDDQAKSGHYTLKFTAVVLDQMGREVSVGASKSVELSTYPLWLRILVICLIILLIIGLVLFYLSRKILPKRITVNTAQTTFIVDGDTVNGAAKCTYSGGGKRSGSLQISTPSYSGDPLVNGGFTLTLQAVSPRRVKSSRRHVQVTSISPSNTAALQTLSVSTHSLVKVDEGGGITWMFDSKQVPSARVVLSTGFDLGGRPNCTLVGETATGVSFTLTVQLLFR